MFHLFWRAHHPKSENDLVFGENVPLPVEERVAKRVQLSKGFLGVDHQSVAGDDSLSIAVHHRDEGIRGGFRADPHSGKILFQQVAVEQNRDKAQEMR